MADKPVLYQRQEHIAQITLNRPDARNLIDDSLAPELREACWRAVEDDEAYVVLLTAAGDTFCAGAAPLSASRSEMHTALARRRVADALAAIPKPVIAALHGDALGQGLELALACDLRVVASGTRFALDQITRGELPWDGGTQRLPRLVPKGVAMEMILTGRQIDADEALQIGLASMVVPSRELAQRSQELAQRVTSMAPIAAAYAKETVHKGMDMPLDQGIRLEADLAILLHTSRDRAEGIRAFQQKRPGSFTGQ